MENSPAANGAGSGSVDYSMGKAPGSFIPPDLVTVLVKLHAWKYNTFGGELSADDDEASDGGNGGELNEEGVHRLGTKVTFIQLINFIVEVRNRLGWGVSSRSNVTTPTSGARAHSPQFLRPQLFTRARAHHHARPLFTFPRYSSCFS